MPHICLVCKLPVVFVPNLLHPHGGYYVHRLAQDGFLPESYRLAGAHEAVPEADPAAVAEILDRVVGDER